MVIKLRLLIRRFLHGRKKLRRGWTPEKHCRREFGTLVQLDSLHITHSCIVNVVPNK
jgi:hypothetical protein